MKWFGEHIWSFKSRMRSDVIVEKDSSIYMGTNQVLSQSGGNVTLANIASVDSGTISTLSTAFTSLGTLTNLQVDDINLNSKTISILGDTSDTFTITTGAAGATTLTTIDAAATAGHFEIAADGNITLDAANDIYLEAAGNDVSVRSDVLDVFSSTSGKPQIKIRALHSEPDTCAEIVFQKEVEDTEDGENLGKIAFFGKNEATEDIEFVRILGEISESDDTDEAGKLTLSVAASDGSDTALVSGLVLEGEHATGGEVDVTVGAGAASTTTIAGKLTMGSTAALDNSGLIKVASQTGITTLSGLTSLGTASGTTNIAAGDLTMYNAVNNGNPTISLGSSATDRLEIKSTYNSGTQALCDIDFTTYTSSGTTNDGRFNWYVDEVLLAVLNDGGTTVYGNVGAVDAGATFTAMDTTASSATQGGKLILRANDGYAMGDGHRLGVIEFTGAEDDASTYTIGARIQALNSAGEVWSNTVNDCSLQFYTTDANASESLVLTLGNDKLATFAGAVTATGALTGTLATVSQPNITTLAGVNSVGTGDAGEAPTGSETSLLVLSHNFNMFNNTHSKPAINLFNVSDNGTSPQFNFYNYRNATIGTSALGDTGFGIPDGSTGGADDDLLGWIGFNGLDSAGNTEEYASISSRIDVAASGQESGELNIQVATHNGTTASGFYCVGGSESGEVDVTLGNGANSVVTVPGDIDLAGDIDVDGTLETDALTINGVTISGTSGRRYGSIIKILPNDFIVNDEGAEGGWFDEDANSGFVVGDATSEMWTFVTIPEGMTATTVNIYSNNSSRNFYVYEMDINANGLGSSLGNTTLNSALTIDVDATATNFLGIKLDLNNVTQRIWGGSITVAPQ